jgi:hypothetical protein
MDDPPGLGFSIFDRQGTGGTTEPRKVEPQDLDARRQKRALFTGKGFWRFHRGSG